MKLIKSMLALAAALSISYLPASVSANDNISVQNTSNLSILIPKNIDMGNADSASFSVQAKGKLNDIDIVTVSADKEVAMKRAGDEYYLNTATVDFSAQWRGSDLNPDTYIEKTGTITFSEKKVGTYTGKLNFTVTHKETFNISYDSVGGVMPVEYPTYYFSDEGLDSLPVPTKDNSKFLGWGETIEYTLGDYWEIGEGGSLLVSDKYAGANSGPQPKAPEGLFPIYREITFSLENEAILSFLYEWTRFEYRGSAVGGEFYLYQNENLIDQFVPNDYSGTEEYTKTLGSGDYQIIFVGYTTSSGTTNTEGVTETVRNFNVVSLPLLDSIPKGSTGDKNLSAVWEPAVIYSISYDPAGGTMPDEYPTYYYSEEGLDYLPVPAKDNSKFLGWGESIEYTLGDYWEIGEDGDLLVSDLYAGANSGPQPKAPEIAGVKPLYRGITFSVESEAMLSFSFDYERNISEVTSTEGGGKFYLYKDETLIDEFTPSGTGELIKGTMDYSKNLDAGNYQIIFEGYVELIGTKQGVTETVRDFNVVSLPLLDSIPKGSTGDKKLSAVWEPAVTYSISYDPAGGTMPAVYPTEYTTDKNVTLPTPVKEGYKFLGWTDTPYFEPSYSYGWEISEDGSYTSTAGEQTLNFRFWLTEPQTLQFEYVYEPTDGAYSDPYYELEMDNSSIKHESLDNVLNPTTFTYELEPGEYTLYFWSGSGTSTISNVVFYGDLFTSIPKGTSGDLNLTAVWERIELSNILETGARFSENIPEGVTNILFTDEIAPEGIEAVDVSAAQDKGIVAWLDGTTWKVSTQRNTVQIIANTNCSRLFENAASLTSIDGLENIDFSSVVYAEYMFSGCTDLTSVPLEEMDLSNVRYAAYMFKDCRSLDGTMTLNLPKAGNSETGYRITGIFEGASTNDGTILLVTGEDDSFTSAAVSTRTEPESKNYGVYLKIKDSYFTVDPESLEGVLENDSPTKITVTFSLKYGSLLYCYDPNDIHIGIQVESTDSEVILIDGADFWMMQEGVAAIVGTVTDADGTEYVRSCEITVTKG